MTYVEPGYFIGVVALPDDCYCIAGLVSPFQHARSEIMQMASLALAPQQMQAYGCPSASGRKSQLPMR